MEGTATIHAKNSVCATKFVKDLDIVDLLDDNRLFVSFNSILAFQCCLWIDVTIDDRHRPRHHNSYCGLK